MDSLICRTLLHHNNMESGHPTKYLTKKVTLQQFGLNHHLCA